MNDPVEYYRALDAAYHDGKHLMAKKLAVVCGLFSGGGRFLDLGCGTGELLARLSSRFDELVGVDASEQALDYSRSKLQGYKNVVLRGDLYGLPEKCFDAAACLDVIEHAREPARLLGDLRRLLRPGARLVVTVPNWFDIVVTQVLRANPLHLHAHTPLGWMRMVGRAGFTVTSWRCVDFPLLHSRFLARRCGWLGMCVLIEAQA